jgi:hypothetical protein
MEHNPFSEAKNDSDSQYILHLLWELKGHYHVHNSPELITILSKLNPFHTVPPYFLKVHFNIILCLGFQSHFYPLLFWPELCRHLSLPCMLHSMPIPINMLKEWIHAVIKFQDHFFRHLHFWHFWFIAHLTSSRGKVRDYKGNIWIYADSDFLFSTWLQTLAKFSSTHGSTH